MAERRETAQGKPTLEVYRINRARYDIHCMINIPQVTGHPKPSIQWQKDGKPLKENPRWKFIEEEDNYTLLIFEVRPDDVGRYDCVAINNVGKATCTAKLNVEGEETIRPNQKICSFPVARPTLIL